MKKETAVEWLIEELEQSILITSSVETKINQAKEIFEQQIIDARQSGINAAINGKSISNIDYYNETFKNKI